MDTGSDDIFDEIFDTLYNHPKIFSDADKEKLKTGGPNFDIKLQLTFSDVKDDFVIFITCEVFRLSPLQATGSPHYIVNTMTVTMKDFTNDISVSFVPKRHLIHNYDTNTYEFLVCIDPEIHPERTNYLNVENKEIVDMGETKNNRLKTPPTHVLIHCSSSGYTIK